MDHVLSMLPQCFRTSLRLARPLQAHSVRHYPRMAGISREERYDINQMNQRVGDKRLEFSAQEVSDFIHKTRPREHHAEGFAGEAEDEREIRDIGVIKRARARSQYMREQQPPNPCLLTCAAREQVRFLHKRDPVEFSAERLAESFPIAVPDLQRLLAKPTRYKSPEATAREDELVAQRWKALKTGKNWREWVSEEQMQLYREGKLRKTRFMGDAALPIPPPIQRYVPPPPVEGPFSELLATVIAEKKRREPVAPAPEVVVGKELLSKGTSLVTQQTDRSLMSVSEQLRVERSTRPEYSPMDGEHHTPYTFQGAVLPNDPGLEDELADPSVPDVRLRRRPDRTFPPGKRVMHGHFTDKMLRNLDARSPEVGAVYREWFRQRERGDGPDGAREVPPPEVDAPRRVVHKYKEAWKQAMKERGEGVGRLDVPVGRAGQGAVYQKGNEFYDEKGQFMYRVPGLVA